MQFSVLINARTIGIGNISRVKKLHIFLMNFFLDTLYTYFYRLFLGMGIIWYFELIGFATDDGSEQKWMWLPDCLNMLQV